MDDLAAVDRRVGRVAAADAQAELLGGVGAHGEHQLQLLARRGVERLLLQHIGDRNAAPQQAGLFVGGAHDVAGGAAGERQCQDGEDRERRAAPADAHDAAAGCGAAATAPVRAAYCSW
jgi:hypothetical protein